MYEVHDRDGGKKKIPIGIPDAVAYVGHTTV